MRKYIVRDVPPSVVKVTRDSDLFDVPQSDVEFGEYATLEARIDVEHLRNVVVEDDGKENGDDVKRTKNTKISLEPNPRGQRFTTDVAQAIRASLLDRDGRFHRKNRGVLLTAHDFHYDNKTRELSWVEEEPQAHGCVDGGHTLAIIDEHVGGSKWNERERLLTEQGAAPKRQFVTIQIVKGLPLDEIPQVAGARNNSVNVEEFALKELEGKFTFLKPVLTEARLFDMVAFKQNEKVKKDGKFIDVVGVLQRLTTLDNREFDDDQKQPYHAYWSRAKTTDEFGKREANYKRLENLTPDALALPEYIIARYRDWYQATSGKANTGRPAFGRTRECRDATRETKFDFLPIVKPDKPKKVGYTLQTDALAMPILAALRTIISRGDGPACWLTDPYDFLDIVGPTLVDSLNSAIAMQRNASIVLKNKDVWKNLYILAKMTALQRGIVKLEAA